MGAKVVRHGYTLPRPPPHRRKGRASSPCWTTCLPHREGVDSRCAVRTLTTLELMPTACRAALA